MNKRDELCRFAVSERPDILGLAETWLNSDVIPQEVVLSGYSCFRCDRKSKAHGGVLLYIKSSLSGKLISTYRSEDSLCEQLWCTIRLRRAELIVGVIYRSPLNRCCDWIPHVQKHMSRPQFLLMGDLNLPKIIWPDVRLLPSHGNVEAQFAKMTIEIGATQHVIQPTRVTPYSASCLDLMFTSCEQKLKEIRVIEPLANSDHCSIVASLELSLPYYNQQKPTFNYWKTDFNGLVQAASQTDWTLPHDASLEAWWSLIKGKLNSLCTRFVPLKYPKIGPVKPHWFDREYRQLARRRRKLWDRYISSGCDEDYTVYKKQRNLCNAAKIKKRRQFEEELASSATTAPKRIFAYLKRQLKPGDDLPVLESLDGKTLISSAERADALATHFLTVFSSKPAAVSVPAQVAQVLLDSLQCDAVEVYQLLVNLDGAKPPGPDGLHPLILKSLSIIISPAVTNLFNRSLSEGSVPNDWKCSIVKPLPKGGDPSKIENYRPICLTSVLSKVLEKVVKKCLLSFFESMDVLTPAQHGFTKGRSCITNLMYANHQWVRALNEQKDVDVVYIDFSKAFDRVNHEVLLRKLRTYGIGGTLLQWIQEFIVGRRFRVQVNDYLTEWFPSTSGVPQGTVLGPVLFLIHINDLPQQLQSPCALFADDLKIWRIIENQDDCARLQHDLERLSTWSTEMQLPLNASKSEFISITRRPATRSYTLDGQLLHPNTSVRDLGVLSRHDLRSLENTEKLYRAGLRMLWALRRSFSTWSEETVPRLFTSLIRPILEYGAPAYHPITQ
ncbi:unnamed protein product [Dicrocoelium dendriticum]|nr:unnamed protein product [Dicrocoelium dendriticum]